MLPQLFPPPGTDDPGHAAGEAPHHASPTRHLADIDGRRYAVVVYPMGESSASRGSLITLSLTAETP